MDAHTRFPRGQESVATDMSAPRAKPRQRVLTAPITGRIGCAALAAALALAGCSGPAEQPPPPQPTGPPGPALSGQLLVQTKDDTVWALHQSGGRITASRTVAAAGPAALSPDGRTLAYVGPSGIVLRDVGTGAEQQPHLAVGGSTVTGYGDCLVWSPDSTRLLFLADGGSLYTTTLDGTVTVIDRPKSATYVPTPAGQYGFPLLPPPLLPPLPAPTGPTYDVSSEITCGAWLDADRVVFDRLAGDMPNSLVQPDASTGPPPVAPDTTTVAVLAGDGATLIDSASRWSLAGACGAQLLTSRAVAGEELGGQGDNSALYLLNGLPSTALAQTNGATPDSAQVPHPNNGTMAMFIPGSCALMVVDLNPNKQSSYDTFRLDPATHSLVPARPLWAYQFFQPGGDVWAPGADPTVFADFAPGEADVTLVDVATGGVTVLKLPDAQAPDQLRALVGWLH
jgi:hypothetical protein